MQFSRLSRIALAISATCLSAGAWAETNQVYSETVSGHNAPMTVDVIMKDGAIKNILVDDRESPGAGKKAIAILKLQAALLFRPYLPTSRRAASTSENSPKKSPRRNSTTNMNLRS